MVAAVNHVNTGMHDLLDHEQSLSPKEQIDDACAVLGFALEQVAQRGDLDSRGRDAGYTALFGRIEAVCADLRFRLRANRQDVEQAFAGLQAQWVAASDANGEAEVAMHLRASWEKA